MRAMAVLVDILAAGHAAADDVFRCTESAGKVPYANAPCESRGASTTRKFQRDELEPTVVKMPKTAPRADRTGAGAPGAALIEGRRGKPIDLDARMQAGEARGLSGPRNVALERMEQRAAGAAVERARARARDLLPE
jgi:hypothetical protein